MQLKKTLYCKEGTSDKTYTLWIASAGDLYVVEAQWGRRGGPQTTGTKTPKPVTLEKAKELYEKILNEKIAKGYHEGEEAPTYTKAQGKEMNLRPMLLTPDIEENIEKYFTNDVWYAQMKFNGKRLMIWSDKDGVYGFNKTGENCPIPQELEKEFAKFYGIFDGELVGDVYHIFDMMANANGKPLVGSPLAYRYDQLSDRIIDIDGCKHIQVSPIEQDEERKRELYKQLKKLRKEGIVFKLAPASYIPGRIDSLSKAKAVKIKFWAEVAAVVIDWTDKRSIEVGLRDGLEIIPVGKVTVPKKYDSQIKIGKPVRVKYLYATDGKKLYQPRLDPTDDGSILADQVMCDLISSLKYEGKDG